MVSGVIAYTLCHVSLVFDTRDIFFKYPKNQICSAFLIAVAF